MIVDTTAPVIAALAEARARTLALLEPIPDPQLVAQHSPIMSPMVWDLAHIAHYEELWLLRSLLGDAGTDARFDDIYDAFRHPRSERPALDLLTPEQARAYAAAGRRRVLDSLSGRPAVDGAAAEALAQHGFVYGMVAQHEHQHDETLLATINLMRAFAHPAASGTSPRRAPAGIDVETEVVVPGGAFVMGTDDEPWAYDNERPAHVVHVDEFAIDRHPVTNGRYEAFVDAGGYDDERWWSPAGWAWRQEAALEYPMGWTRAGDGWARRRFGRDEPLPRLEPVQHVCWYEADAFARFAGKRLPTEAEWEKAARWDPRTGTSRLHPWGGDEADETRADLWGLAARWAPDEVGTHPAGASALGCEGLEGGVWEWTASEFAAYPGFRPFPYREYSEVFFDDGYRVLRGGSWATHPLAMRATFRNWDLPIRRQIFAGFRCARSI